MPTALVRHQLLVEVLAVPASKLGGQVIHRLERPHLVEDAGNLADVAHVAAHIVRLFHVSAQAEADFIGAVRQVARDHVVAAPH